MHFLLYLLRSTSNYSLLSHNSLIFNWFLTMHAPISFYNSMIYYILNFNYAIKKCYNLILNFFPLFCLFHLALCQVLEYFDFSLHRYLTLPFLFDFGFALPSQLTTLESQLSLYHLFENHELDRNHSCTYSMKYFIFS